MGKHTRLADRRPTGEHLTPNQLSGGGAADGGAGEVRDIVTAAEIHQEPRGRDTNRAPPEGPRPATTTWTRPRSPSPGWSRQERQRGRSPTPRSAGGRPVSPSSGNARLYYRSDSGNMRSLDRSKLYPYNSKKGIVPRSPSTPRHNYATAAQVPADRCRRCFRYIGAEMGPNICKLNRCLRYLESPITSTVCKICKGGFHNHQICSRRSRSNSRSSRSGDKSPGFNRKMSLND